MKSIHQMASLLKKLAIPMLLIAGGFLFYSFTVNKLSDDFLKELGISKIAAHEKITQGVFSRSVDIYGVRNAKNIMLGKRSEVVKDLLVYTRGYLSSDAFKKEYEVLRQNNKPKAETVKTPDQLRNETIASLKKMITETETKLKTASTSMKPIFEDVLKEGRKQLAEAESPTNKQFERYAKGYPQLVKDMEARHEGMLKEWEKVFPENHLQFLQPRLEEFLDITKDVDFTAELISKNGKKVFVNPDYENKDGRWKMAFRAGKEVVIPARKFVEEWLQEIK